MERIAFVLGWRGFGRIPNAAQVKPTKRNKKLSIFDFFSRFSLLDKGSKILYLNTSARGYPLGLRAGKDPRNPIISVDGGFEKVRLI